MQPENHAEPDFDAEVYRLEQKTSVAPVLVDQSEDEAEGQNLSGEEQREFERQFLLTELQHIKAATLEQVDSNRETQRQVRDKKQQASELEKESRKGGGGVGTTLLIGALTGNIGLAVAAGGSRPAKNKRIQRKLEESTREFKRYQSKAKKGQGALARLLRRQNALESLLNEKSKLTAWVNNFGILLTILLVLTAACITGMLVSLGSFWVGAVIAAAGLVAVIPLWGRCFRPIRQAMKDYPRIRPGSADAFPRTRVYRFLCLGCAALCVGMVLLMVYVTYPMHQTKKARDPHRRLVGVGAEMSEPNPRIVKKLRRTTTTVQTTVCALPEIHISAA